MRDNRKTKQQLILELEALHRRIAELEKSETEHKRTEEALRESEEKFSKIFRTSPDAVAIARTSDGVYIDVNEGYTKISGYSREELLSRSPLPGDLNLWVRKEDRAPFAATLKETGEALGLEVQFRRKDGSIRTGLLSAGVLDIKGESCHVAIISDITERKKAEEDLQHQRWRLASIIEGTRVGTWEWNVQTGETVFNERWAQILGYSLEELLPISIQTWERLAHPDDLKQSYDLLRRHFAGELPYYDFECRMRHKEGHWIWVQDRGRVMTRTSEGDPLLMSGTHTDITEQKEAEEALIKSEERLRALSTRIQSVREEERINIAR